MLGTNEAHNEPNLCFVKRGARCSKTLALKSPIFHPRDEGIFVKYRFWAFSRWLQWQPMTATQQYQVGVRE